MKYLLNCLIVIRLPLRLVALVVFVLLASNGYSQTKKNKILLIKVEANFKYEYEVLKSDTSIKQGSYNLFYKNTLIEQGVCNEGNKVGLWRYYNLKGIFEYEYDYDKNQVTRLSGRRDPNVETPCLFKGSPLIPYLFIIHNIHYPLEAFEKKITGKVVLALKVSKEGEVWSYYLVDKLHHTLDSEVLRVVRRFPDSWEWLPATKLRVPIDDEYLITIEFEL